MYCDIFKDEEVGFEYELRLFNLTTLLEVKKEFGDVVDISDRLIGSCSCGNCTNMPFLFSVIAVILSLDEKDESFLDYWAETVENLFKERPELNVDTLPIDRDDEAFIIIFPKTSYHEVILEVLKEYNPTTPFHYQEIKEDTCFIIFEAWLSEFEYIEELVRFFTLVRKKSLGMEVISA